MQKDDAKLFNEKAELVYEFDKRSPLFIRRANKEIEVNNLEEACHTLESGLAIYPDYPTAHVLLGRALSLLGNYQQAQEHYSFAASLIDSEQSFLMFQKEVEAFKKMRSPFSVSKPATHVEEQVDWHSEQDEQFIAKPTFDDLEELARKIEKAKIAVVEEDQEDIVNSAEQGDDEPFIVSETLAKIYAAQNRFAEAISVYRLLGVKFPERRNEFETIIAGLESKLSS